jgi:hypothetical protein
MKNLYLRLEKLLPDTPENKALLLDVAALEHAAREMVEATSLFSHLEMILDALDKSGELTKPICDHSTLFGLNFGGGSAMLHVGNLRALTQAAEKLSACLPEHRKYGCHCDLEPGMEPDGCAIDDGKPENCVYAREGMKKEECKFWKPVVSE